MRTSEWCSRLSLEEVGEKVVALFEQDNVNVLGSLVGLRRQAGPKIHCIDALLGETSDVGPGLLGGDLCFGLGQKVAESIGLMELNSVRLVKMTV